MTVATISIGNSVVPHGTGANDGVPFPSQVRTLTLTNGGKVFEATVTCAANATTDIWTASTHGVSSTVPAADIVFVAVDPAQDETASLTVDLILTYTTTATTSTNTQPTYELAKREHGVLAYPGSGIDSSLNVRYLTRVQVRNRNTGTNDAVKVFIQAWN